VSDYPVDETLISDWRINYGLDARSPADAMRWWHQNMDGKCPAGAVAALGLCINEIEHLRAELETERARLAACGVVAMSNTPESAVAARQIHPEYRSASCDDVAQAVDREIALRAELAEARRELREATEAMDDPAINNLVTLPDAIRALVAAYRSGLEWDK
jgi:hypothetical protein